MAQAHIRTCRSYAAFYAAGSTPEDFRALDAEVKRHAEAVRLANGPVQ
jgi:hypothetical protein